MKGSREQRLAAATPGLAVVVAALLGLGAAPVLRAQTPGQRTPQATVAPGPPAQPAAGLAPAPPSEAGTVADRPAEETREVLRDLLRQYPPAVSEVLRLSPSLASDSGYLQPYPALSGLLAAHPEILRNPSFYFGSARPGEWDEPSDATRRARIVSGMFADFGVFAGLMTLLGVMAWLLRSTIEHQRWKRALKVQADAHAKLLDRLATTDEVLAYAQTPAGRQFLESGAPAPATRRDVSPPIGRILWSVQMGMVVAAGGLGLFFCAARFAADPELAEASPFLFLLGTVALAVGLGALGAAAISFVLSRRLGLFPSAEPTHG